MTITAMPRVGQGHCATDPDAPFADTAEERAAFIQSGICIYCPAQPACYRAGYTDSRGYGVWGGVDFTRRPAQSLKGNTFTPPGRDSEAWMSVPELATLLCVEDGPFRTALRTVKAEVGYRVSPRGQKRAVYSLQDALTAVDHMAMRVAS